MLTPPQNGTTARSKVAVSDLTPLLSRVGPGAAAALAALAVLATPAVFGSHYETNDDAIMNLIAAGRVFVDRPDEHLLFTSVLLGLPLKWLYAVAPGVPWYGGLQLGILALAAAGIAYALLRASPTWRQVAAVVLVLAVVVLPCVVLVQFTRTAFLAGLAGLLLLFGAVLAGRPRGRGVTVCGLGLFTLGSLVRFEAAGMALVLAVPVAAVAVWRDRSRGAGAGRARRLLPLGAALALAAAGWGFNREWYAADPEWKDFYAYNALRADFIDYGRYQYSPAEHYRFEHLGWKPVDLQMLQNWYLADEQQFGLDKLREAAAALAPAARVPVDQDAAAIAGAIPGQPRTVAVLAASICIVLLGGGWPRAAAAAGLSALAFALCVYLFNQYWLPERVGFLLFAGVPPLVALFPEVSLAGRWSTRLVRGSLAVAGALGAVCLAGWSLLDLDSAGLRLAVDHRVVRGLVSNIGPDNSKVYIVWGECFPFERAVTPLDDPAALRNFRCLHLSSVWPTPLTRRRLAALGARDVQEAVARADTYLVADPDKVRMYQAYCAAHGWPAPDLRKLALRNGEHFWIYRAEPPADAK